MELPPPFDLLWGAREPRPTRGRGLSAEQVARAGVELADYGGLAAASMSRIAERVGFTTMAAYRHVRNKDELVALMVEEAVGQPSTPAGSPDEWRTGLERWSRELQNVVEHHPWLVALPLARMPFGPNRLAWVEAGLRALADTPLEELEKAALVLLLNGYVFSEARLSAEVRQDDDAVPDAASGPGDLFDAIVDAERFPAVRRALEAGMFASAPHDRDADFAFGLERILDGIEQLIARRTPGGARAAAEDDRRRWGG